MFEETGIKANNLELIYTIKKVEKNTFYKMYTCRCNIKKDSIVLQDVETIDYKWVTKNELINLIDSDNFVSPDKSKLLQFIEVL